MFQVLHRPCAHAMLWMTETLPLVSVGRSAGTRPLCLPKGNQPFWSLQSSRVTLAALMRGFSQKAGKIHSFFFCVLMLTVLGQGGFGFRICHSRLKVKWKLWKWVWESASRLLSLPFCEGSWVGQAARFSRCVFLLIPSW